MAIADLRREYNFVALNRADLDADPIRQFSQWFEQAAGTRASGRLRGLCIKLYKKLFLVAGGEPMDLNAMTLATVDKEGRPSARIVLLKGLDERGFVFFTNYESRKGQELEANPNAALVFYWPEQVRQVCVAGAVTKLSGAESDDYFRTRPRGSQLEAWASQQSTVVPDRAALEAKWKELHAQHAGKDVPRPPFWGGYCLAPTRLEFWQGRPNRLHDRFRYTRQPDRSWQIERLSP
jgi:pyridoxamine 5'-phosphate oxidase